MIWKTKEAAMPTLAAAVNNGHWDLAAHVLILAALQTLNEDGGRLSDGKKKRARKRQAKRLS
jgi:hypothetical protein